MPATIILTRPTFTTTDSLPPATFNNVTVLSATVPDAEAGAFGVIRLAGDLTGPASAPVLVATGVTVGTYGDTVLQIPQLTIDAKGRITAATNRALGTAYGKTVIDAADAAAARTVLALGNCATLNIGTVAGTVCAGDDARLSNSRKCDNTFDNTATARTNLGLGNCATLDIGTVAGKVCAGDDSRLSNSRKCDGTFDNTATARTALGLGALATATFYESAEQAFPVAFTEVTVAHGLGGVPKDFKIVLRCVTAQYGYAVGDELEMGEITDWRMRWANATTLGFKCNDNTPSIYRRDTNAAAGITAANWKLVFRAFR